MFGLRSLVKYFSWISLCSDGVIVLTKREPKSVIGYTWFQDGGLYKLTDKFHLANILITPYILRSVEDWTRHKLKTNFWLRCRFCIAMPSKTSFYSWSPFAAYWSSARLACITKLAYEFQGWTGFSDMFSICDPARQNPQKVAEPQSKIQQIFYQWGVIPPSWVFYWL